MSRSRWIVLTIALVLPLAGLGASAALAGDSERRQVLDRIELPQGYQPEGITTDGRRLYVGSLADGSLLRADPRTGNTHVLPQSPTGSPAVGIEYDDGRDVLWVAGGPAGEVRAHDASSGRLLATYTFPGTDSRFVNDVVVTEDAVYATDSQNAELGVVELTDPDEVPPAGDVSLLPLTGDFQLEPGFNVNGIIRLEEEDWLVIVQSNTGLLFRVDPASGETRVFDLGDVTLLNGDGLEADEDTVYVVRNRDNLIVVLELDDDDLTGELLAELTDPDLDVPTTAALIGDDLYAVNARFGNADPTAADYWITRFDAVREDDDDRDDDNEKDDRDDDEKDDKDDKNEKDDDRGADDD